MDGVVGSVATSGTMFVGTNIDDIVVLTVLFLSARVGGLPRPWQIWAGQYAGVAALVAVSAVAALGLVIVPNDYVGLLGLIPFVLGVRGLIVALRSDEDASPAVATGLVSVAGVTIANGADNISVYTSVFRTIGTGSVVVTAVVFVVGVALWCLAGSWLGSHQAAIEVVERHGEWIVPAVFMAIGGFIVIESGVLSKIF